MISIINMESENMLGKKIRKIGRYLLLLTTIFVMIGPNVISEIMEYEDGVAVAVASVDGEEGGIQSAGVSYSYTSIPGCAVTVTKSWENSDNYDFQIRESQVYITPTWKERNGKESLVGYTQHLVLYFGPYCDNNLELVGSRYDKFTDGSVYEGPAGLTAHWWNDGPNITIIEYIFEGAWDYKELKYVIYDVDYYEDGLFVRRIYRIFFDWDELETVAEEYNSVEMNAEQVMALEGTSSIESTSTIEQVSEGWGVMNVSW